MQLVHVYWILDMFQITLISLWQYVRDLTLFKNICVRCFVWYDDIMLCHFTLFLDTDDWPSQTVERNQEIKLLTCSRNCSIYEKLFFV